MEVRTVAATNLGTVIDSFLGLDVSIDSVLVALIVVGMGAYAVDYLGDRFDLGGS